MKETWTEVNSPNKSNWNTQFGPWIKESEIQYLTFSQSFSIHRHISWYISLQDCLTIYWLLLYIWYYRVASHVLCMVWYGKVPPLHTVLIILWQLNRAFLQRRTSISSWAAASLSSDLLAGSPPLTCPCATPHLLWSNDVVVRLIFNQPNSFNQSLCANVTPLRISPALVPLSDHCITFSPWTQGEGALEVHWGS